MLCWSFTDHQRQLYYSLIYKPFTVISKPLTAAKCAQRNWMENMMKFFCSISDSKYKSTIIYQMLDYLFYHTELNKNLEKC